MKNVPSSVLESLWHDADAREVLLRRLVTDRLAEKPAPSVDDHVVATYFFAFRTQSLADAVADISYHATSGVKHPPKGSLLEQCSASPAGVDAFDSTGRMGLLHVAFPLKMMRQPDGHVTSCDLLHTVAGAIIFDVYENQDSRLIALNIPDDILRTFPGPAHGPASLRKMTGFGRDQPAFGTILKPTAGITADDVGRIMNDVAGCPLLMFIKEDEDLYPNLDYSPVAERTRKALESIERVKHERGGLGLVFAPHVSGAPHEILDTVHAVIEAGATGVMFSETYATGTVRMVREATKGLPNPPAIYGHNAGIGTRTRGIFREVVDTLARLDGIDFRQTAPVKPGTPFLRAVRAGMARLGRRLDEAPRRSSQDDDHPRRRARSGEHHPEPARCREARDHRGRAVPRRLRDQLDQERERGVRPEARRGGDDAGARRTHLRRASRYACRRASRCPGRGRRADES